MATVNRNRISRIQTNRSKTDFTKVGGLSDHLRLLREIIILPLLYRDLYTHFNIKAPRGVIFYGPPGTGKTLVAGALANELNKEGNGKVAFFQRKGADILDKWVGESERKLRDLFEKATRSRPSVIFFDELDGLAPERSLKNDQVHSSIVATLLALMDGLDNMTGVIVIGATNRIDSIDPALRRPGRFDRELFFPLPCHDSRKEILQVHTKSWKHKPTTDFLNRLAELTAGCCGSDLQALCAEAVLCCLKRKYPTIYQKNKINIQIESLRVEEQDFLSARLNVTPTSQRMGNSMMRGLNTFIKPLLERQTDKIIKHLQVLLPHFTQLYRKFLVGNERYAGRLVLKGSAQQGVNCHVIPAVLQSLEHLQNYVLDSPAAYKKVFYMAVHNVPSILVLSRVDEWWDIMESSSQVSILSLLDNLHAGLPILLIATCGKDLPDQLHHHFYYNSSIVIQIDNPTSEERERFFAPLFFGNNLMSVYRIWQLSGLGKIKEESSSSKACKPKGDPVTAGHNSEQDSLCKKLTNSLSYTKHKFAKKGGKCEGKIQKKQKKEVSKTGRARDRSGAVTDLVNCKNITTKVKEEPPSHSESGSLALKQHNNGGYAIDRNAVDIYALWKRVSNVTSKGLPVLQLELLYDTILACVYIHKDSFPEVIKGVENALINFEHTCPASASDV